MMVMLKTEQLVPHPDNANRMAPALLDKLVGHIRETGKYPPLIVRRLEEGQYQILDGHHRAEALRQLDSAEVNCEIWEVDDMQATMLLLTLNRLHGVDDPRKRGALLLRLQDSHTVRELVKRLPENAAKIRKLLEFTKPPPKPIKPPSPEDMPHPLTFFLTGRQRRQVLAKLGELSGDRMAALFRALGIQDDGEGEVAP